MVAAARLWLQCRLIPRFDGLSVASRRIAEQFAPGTPWVRNEGGIGDTVVSRFEHPSVPAWTVDRPFTIVFAGSLTEINGIPEIVAAFAQLNGREFRLLVAGRGPEEEVIQRAVAGMLGSTLAAISPRTRSSSCMARLTSSSISGSPSTLH